MVMVIIKYGYWWKIMMVSKIQVKYGNLPRNMAWNHENMVNNGETWWVLRCWHMETYGDILREITGKWWLMLIGYENMVFILP